MSSITTIAEPRIIKGAIIKHPSIFKIVGKSKSGKTYFLGKFLEKNQELIDPPPQRIKYFISDPGANLRIRNTTETSKIDGAMKIALGIKNI